MKKSLDFLFFKDAATAGSTTLFCARLLTLCLLGGPLPHGPTRNKEMAQVSSTIFFIDLTLGPFMLGSTSPIVGSKRQWKAFHQFTLVGSIDPTEVKVDLPLHDSSTKDTPTQISQPSKAIIILMKLCDSKIPSVVRTDSI